MKFDRKTSRSNSSSQENKIKFFKPGKNEGTIKSVELKQNKNKDNMFQMVIEGENGEKGYYFLTFGNDYTEDNLNYLLTSIEDHGYSIPDMNFWFNRETADFLEEKEIYFNVEDEKINGKTMYNIKRILLLSEFEGEDSGESFEDDYDPFSNED